MGNWNNRCDSPIQKTPEEEIQAHESMIKFHQEQIQQIKDRQKASIRKERLVKSGLSKLTDAEREALGL